MKRVVGLRMGRKMPVPADRRGVAWRLRAAVASSEAQGLQRSAALVSVRVWFGPRMGCMRCDGLGWQREEP